MQTNQRADAACPPAAGRCRQVGGDAGTLEIDPALREKALKETCPACPRQAAQAGLKGLVLFLPPRRATYAPPAMENPQTSRSSLRYPVHRVHTRINIDDGDDPKIQK